MIRNTLVKPVDATSAATDFVKLVQSRGNWIAAKFADLNDEARALILGMLDVAGFEFEKIVDGELSLGVKDDENNPVGNTVINRHIGFKVECADEFRTVNTTGWLDAMFARVATASGTPNAFFHLIVEDVTRLIDESRPFQMIRLTKQGDYLIEPVPHKGSYFTTGSDYFVKHKRDTDELPGVFGFHKRCGGQIGRTLSNETQDALVCRNCYLRIPISTAVRTYGDLRKQLEINIALGLI